MDKIIKLRIEIDNIDEKLLDLIAERLVIVRGIGEEKKTSGIEVVDKDRESEVLERLKKKAVEKGVDPDVVEKLWRVIMDASYRIEEAENANG
jgi:chorismate mutase / prephenate dehydrogenase